MPAKVLNRRLLEDALGGDVAAWRSAWTHAARYNEERVQSVLLESCDGDARVARLAPWLVDWLERVEDNTASRRERGRTARELSRLLRRIGHAPYVCRSQQWGNGRILHLGWCGAPRHMTLTSDSARWDFVAGALCRRCRRALYARA